MKTFQTIFSVLFLLSINLCYSQNYKFDKIVKDKLYNQYFPNKENTKLFNSEDDSYHMNLYYRNDSLVSFIFDRKKKQMHYFHIDKSDSLKFYFIKTKKFNENVNENVNENKLEFSEIKEKKGNKEITLKILNEREKKIAQYQFIIKETDKNYFSLIKSSFLETEGNNKTKPPFNFIILEAKGKNESGLYIKYKLESIKDIYLEITIPDRADMSSRR